MRGNVRYLGGLEEVVESELGMGMGSERVRVRVREEGEARHRRELARSGYSDCLGGRCRVRHSFSRL